LNADLANINPLLILAGFVTLIDSCQIKYFEHEHRFIKKTTKLIMEFKA